MALAVIAVVLYVAAGIAAIVFVYTLGVHMGREFAYNERRDALAQDERRMMAVELEYKALREQETRGNEK